MKTTTLGDFGLTYDNDKIRVTGGAAKNVDLQGWWLDAPEQGQWGQQVSLSRAQVRNTGSSASGSFAVQFYLSKDKYGSSNDVLLSRADGVGSSYQHSSIAGGKNGNYFYPKLNLPAKAPAGFSGENFYIVMKTDSGGDVKETNEGNNFGGLKATYDNDTIRILGQKGKADLHGWWTKVSDLANWGGTIDVQRAQIRNAGEAASGSFKVQWYLSKDRYGSGDDILLSACQRRNFVLSRKYRRPHRNGSEFQTKLVLPSSPPAGWNGDKFYVVMKTRWPSTMLPRQKKATTLAKWVRHGTTNR